MLLTTQINQIQELQLLIEERNGYKFQPPTHDRFTSPLSRIHEIGHHALFPVWGIEWAQTIDRHHKSRGLVRSIAPWIPSLELPFELLPEEQTVKYWTALQATAIGFDPSFNRSKATVLGDHATNESCDAALFSLPVFGKTPQKYLSEWCDGLEMRSDSFSLPNPIATDIDGILENWHSIATYYADRCPPRTIKWLESLPNSWHEVLKAQFCN
jgi:hypothetical protein